MLRTAEVTSHGSIFNPSWPQHSDGGFMREYWLPAYMTLEVEADGAPHRVKLLGEKLIAFKTNEGRYVLMDHVCPHRCNDYALRSRD